MKNQIEKIYLGYWYQRTTLHLSEVFDFFRDVESPLELDKRKLQRLWDDLNIKSVEMKIGHFEYLEMTTKHGVRVIMYEDGLVLFEKDFTKEAETIRSELTELNEYFEKRFSPAINYLFSLGAPIPKELANIKTVSPFFVTIKDANSDILSSTFRQLRERKYYEIKGEGVELYRGGNVFLLHPQKGFKNTQELIEMQIYFREFKVQLHRYLNIHRIIWEKIADIKEQGKIRGRDLEQLHNRLESYKKTIELIEGRIEQMGTHLKTRKNLIDILGWGGFLSNILEFKYDTLDNSLSYIKALWKMTKNYVDSAIRVFSDLQAESTKDSVKTLTLITSIWVISGILGYLTANKLPQFTIIGVTYFLILLAATWLANKLIVLFYQRRKYEIKSVEVDKKID